MLYALASTALIAVALLTGCGTSQNIYVATDVPAKGGATGRPTFGMPVLLPQSEWAIVPFALERQLQPMEFESDYGPSSSYAGERYERKLFHFRPQSVVWHNAIFEHQKTGETRLLLDRKGVITQFTPIAEPRKPDEEAKRPEFLVFGIAENDDDGDTIINADDAVRAYVCNIDGTGLRSATPAGTQLAQVAYDAEDRVLYLMALNDSNADKRFTTDDSATLYRFTLEAGQSVPVVNDALRQRAESLLK